MPKENPVLWSDVRSREEHRRARIFSILVFLAICAFLIGVAWTVIYSPLFKIKSIEISGNSSVSNDSIMALATAEIFGDSLWKRILGTRNILAWPNSFSGSNLKFLPELKSFSVEKSYGQRKIKITVEEKKPFGVWCLLGARISADETQISADINNIQPNADVKNVISENQLPNQRESAFNCWWFDSSGVIFRKAISVEGNLIASLSDYSQKNIGLNSKILPDEFIPNIFSIFRAVSASGLSVKEMRLNDLALQEIEVDTYNGLPADLSAKALASVEALAKAGPKIYFSLRFTADNVPEVIKSLKEKTTFGSLQYVDFRVENRVYYK
ncbi:MAG: FtsQ-type POTRA domain-containing protein [bacterium]|nr:FtsQ-type POTRA domain-containing protein [bacterium]